VPGDLACADRRHDLARREAAEELNPCLNQAVTCADRPRRAIHYPPSGPASRYPSAVPHFRSRRIGARYESTCLLLSSRSARWGTDDPITHPVLLSTGTQISARAVQPAPAQARQNAAGALPKHSTLVETLSRPSQVQKTCPAVPLNGPAPLKFGAPSFPAMEPPFMVRVP
jgi:hypothetical protein